MDQEETGSDTIWEDERVSKFAEALNRMHDDPAEAARIDSIIDDFEEDPGHAVPGHAVGDDPAQSVVVHIHNDGENSSTHFSMGTTPDPAVPAAEPEAEASKPRPTHTWDLRLSALPLVLMAAVAMVAIQTSATEWLSASLAMGFAMTSAFQIFWGNPSIRRRTAIERAHRQERKTRSGAERPMGARRIM
ncbi:hypothetical protein [Streptomyces sp. NPDC055287]